MGFNYFLGNRVYGGYSMPNPDAAGNIYVDFALTTPIDAYSMVCVAFGMYNPGASDTQNGRPPLVITLDCGGFAPAGPDDAGGFVLDINLEAWNLMTDSNLTLVPQPNADVPAK